MMNLDPCHSQKHNQLLSEKIANLESDVSMKLNATLKQASVIEELQRRLERCATHEVEARASEAVLPTNAYIAREKTEARLNHDVSTQNLLNELLSMQKERMAWYEHQSDLVQTLHAQADQIDVLKEELSITERRLGITGRLQRNIASIPSRQSFLHDHSVRNCTHNTPTPALRRMATGDTKSKIPRFTDTSQLRSGLLNGTEGLSLYRACF
ncbi:unnamed protein product [Dicrocoelium dendriticum]|nr:unnamed protein product [Dicrocoelium dendriticum]